MLDSDSTATTETSQDSSGQETSSSKTYSTSETADETETVSSATTESGSTVESEVVDSSIPSYETRFQLPHEVLSHIGRHIRAEDLDWIASPVPCLVDIILESCRNVCGPELTTILKNTNDSQREKLQELLPLELPLKLTLPILKDGEYWKRGCLEMWKASDVWWYDGNWKSMFVERQVQEFIENFVPGISDISKLKESISEFKDYVLRLRIRKIERLITQPLKPNFNIDMDWQEFLDDFDIELPSKCYVDFTAILPLFPKLQELSIILSPILLGTESSDFPDADFFGILKQMKNLPQLQKFRFSNGGITNSQIVAATRIFLNHKSLKELDFSFNFANDECCDYFGKLLVSSCPLEKLLLRYNRIADDGVAVLAAALVENAKLKTLDLALNYIGDDGAEFLAKCLVANSTLEILNISENKMGMKAGMAIAELLLQSTTLKLLNVSHNALGKEAGRHLRIAMDKNTTLLELNVECCKFNEEEESSIYKAITRNRLLLPHFSFWDKKVNYV